MSPQLTAQYSWAARTRCDSRVAVGAAACRGASCPAVSLAFWSTLHLPPGAAGWLPGRAFSARFVVARVCVEGMISRMLFAFSLPLTPRVIGVCPALTRTATRRLSAVTDMADADAAPVVLDGTFAGAIGIDLG